MCVRMDGRPASQPGDTDPFSVSGLGAGAALTETSPALLR